MSVPRAIGALALVLATQATAHGGHEDVPEGEVISADPIVGVFGVQLSDMETC
jgi:hypothetical protein